MDRIRLRPIPRSSWSAPRRLAQDSVLLAVPRSQLLCRNTIMSDHGASAGPTFAPRTFWFCQRHASISIGGLSTGFGRGLTFR
jgi:hypothetical protein